MKISKINAMISLSFCLLIGDAAGADGFYIELSPGVSILADADISGAGFSGKAEFDPCLCMIAGAVGYRFLDQVRSEINLSYRQVDVNELNAPSISLDGRGDASAFAVMANAYYDFDIGYSVSPYLGIGIGFANIEVDTGSSDTVLAIDDNSSEFAWNVMVGISEHASEHIVLSLGYRYFGTTEPELSASALGVSSVKLKAKIELHEILFGFRYNF